MRISNSKETHFSKPKVAESLGFESNAIIIGKNIVRGIAVAFPTVVILAVGEVRAAPVCGIDGGGNVTCSNGTITAPITVYDAAAAFQPVNGSNSYTPANPKFPAATNRNNPGYNPAPAAVTISLDATTTYTLTTNTTANVLADRGMIAANFSNTENPAVNNVIVNNAGTLGLTTAQIAQSGGGRMDVLVADSQVNSFTVNNTGTIAVTQNFFSAFNAKNLNLTSTGTPAVNSATYSGATLADMSGIYSDDNTESLVVNNSAQGRITATGNYATPIYGRADTTVTNSGTIAQTDWTPNDTIATGHWAIAAWAGTDYRTVPGTNPDTGVTVLTNGAATVTDTSSLTITNNPGALIKGDILALDVTPLVYAAAIQNGASFPLTISGSNAGPRDSNIENQGTITGNLYLGSGAHVLDNASGATIVGSINVDQRASQASFTVADAGTVAGTYRSAGGADFNGNACAAVGTNTTNGGCASTHSQVASFVGNKTFTFTNNGTVTGNITIIDQAGSQNTITLGTGSQIGGNISAKGLGNNALILSSTATGGGGGGGDDDDDAPAAAPSSAAAAAATGPTGPGTLTSNVSGFTTLLQTDGDWTLAAGTTQSFSNSATISGGSLTVNSTLIAPTISVGTDGTLAGVGTMVGTLTNAGVVNPGNAQTPNGTLSLTGKFIQVDGGVFASNITADGLASRLAVTGTASLGGSALLTGTSGTYVPGTRYTIVTTTGGISGAFTEVDTSGLPTLIGAAASTDGRNAYATLTQNSFTLVAQTPNQVSTATGVDALLAGNTAALTVLDNRSDSANAALLDRLSGQGYANFADPELRAGRAFTDQMLARAFTEGAELVPATGFQSFYAADLKAIPAPRVVETIRTYGVWASGYGEFGTVYGTTNTAARKDTVAGIAGGVDFHPSNTLMVGLAAGYSAIDLTLSQTGDHGHTDNGQVGAYAGFAQGATYANVAIGYAHAEGYLSRSLNIGALQPNNPRGNVSGDQFLSAGEAGYKIAFAPVGTATPFVGYQVGTFDQSAIREGGGGLFNLNVAAKDFLSARGLVGARLETSFDVEGRNVSIFVKAAYAREFADVDRTISSSFALAPAAPFLINGARLDRDRGIVGAGLSAKLAPGLSGFVNYDGDFAKTDQIQAVRGGLRYTF